MEKNGRKKPTIESLLEENEALKTTIREQCETIVRFKIICNAYKVEGFEIKYFYSFSLN